MRNRCPTRLRCAAPATKCARSKSTSPRCSSNCARRSSTRSAHSRARLRSHVPRHESGEPRLCQRIALPPAQRLGRIGLRFFTGKDGWIHRLPSLGARWTMSRDLRGLPEQTFREWWAARERSKEQASNEPHPLLAPGNSRSHPRRDAQRRCRMPMPIFRATTSARGSLDHAARLHLMTERLREYDAEVVESSPARSAAPPSRVSFSPAAAAPLSRRPACPPTWLARRIQLEDRPRSLPRGD